MFATLLGNWCGDAWGVGSDAAGDVVITGFGNGELATVDPWQPDNAGSMDAVVVRLDAMGEPVFSTWLGGSGTEDSVLVAVDGLGRSWVLARTRSADFPEIGGAGLPPRPATSSWHVAMARLDVAGRLELGAVIGDDTALWGMPVSEPLACAPLGSAILFGGLSGAEGFPTTAGALMEAAPVEGFGRWSGYVSVIGGTVSHVAPPTTQAHPLRLSSSGPQLVLGWDETLGGPGVGFRLYRGSIASLRTRARWDHVPLLPCLHDRSPVSVPLPEGDAYFLVARVKDGEESSLGTDSFGRERPRGRAPCP